MLSKKPETFTFLGFTHYCSHAKSGKFRVKRKTSKKKFNKNLSLQVLGWLGEKTFGVRRIL